MKPAFHADIYLKYATNAINAAGGISSAISISMALRFVNDSIGFRRHCGTRYRGKLIVSCPCSLNAFVMAKTARKRRRNFSARIPSAFYSLPGDLFTLREVVK